jgi:hypothetical protein
LPVFPRFSAFAPRGSESLPSGRCRAVQFFRTFFEVSQSILVNLALFFKDAFKMRQMKESTDGH